MQLDADTLLLPAWDRHLLQALRRAPSEQVYLLTGQSPPHVSCRRCYQRCPGSSICPDRLPIAQFNSRLCSAGSIWLRMPALTTWH
jgi:hypothetical protein